MGLFALNYAGPISAWLAPPPGTVALLVPRATDIAQYVTWMEAFRVGLLAPDYHAPWPTAPAIFNPLLFGVARLSDLLGRSVIEGYVATHALLHVAGVYAVVYAVRAFTITRGERVICLVMLLCSVPILTVLYLPLQILGLPSPVGPDPVGIGPYVWDTNDGLLHGINPSLLKTFGTVSTLLVFGAFARYLRERTLHRLFIASGLVFVGAFGHPFEVFAVVPAALLTLRLVDRRTGAPRARTLRDSTALAAAGVLGLLPYGIMWVGHDWIRVAAALNHAPMSHFARSVAYFGVPAVLALLVVLSRARPLEPTDVLARCWLAVVAVAVHAPFLPWGQHVVDGVLVAVSIVAARFLAHRPELRVFRASHPRALTAAVAACVVLSVSGAGSYYAHAAQVGRLAGDPPPGMHVAAAPREELLLLAWLRANASSSDVVLSPLEHSPWVATARVRSLASHPIFSLTFNEQKAFVTGFLAGELSADEIRRGVEKYQIRFLVTRSDPTVLARCGGCAHVASFGRLDLFRYGS